MKAPKMSTVKNATKIVVAKSVYFCVAGAVTAVVPTETKIEKIQVMIGSYVIAAMVAHTAENYVDFKFAQYYEMVRQLNEELAKAQRMREEQATMAGAPN